MRLCPKYISFIGLLCLVAGFSCAGSQPITFMMPRPPLVSLLETRQIASIGFNGDNLRLNSQLDFLFSRLLTADSTIVLIDPVKVLRALSGQAYIAGMISDSIAVKAGRTVDADAILLGEFSTRFTEEYGEEKKFRTAEAFGPSSQGTQIRLAQVAYQEPYINQVVTLTAVIQALDVATGQRIGSDRVVVMDTLHLVLPTIVEEPPDGPIEVQRITPRLVDCAMVALSRQLKDRFSWHSVRTTRYMARKVERGDSGLTAALNGNWEEARMIWEQAVQDNPDNAGAWNNLAIAYEQAGQLAEAQEAYNRAQRLGPDDPTIRQNTASKR